MRDDWQFSGGVWLLYRPCGHNCATIWSSGTWSTWDRNGTGGENSLGKDVDQAKRQVVIALDRQGWHGDDCETSPKMVPCPTCDGEGEIPEPTPSVPAVGLHGEET